MPVSATAAPATPCTGTLAGIVRSDVTVPAAASCTATDAAVSGDVTLGAGSVLVAPDTSLRIGGSVRAGPGATFSVRSSQSMSLGTTLSVGGSIRVDEAGVLDVALDHVQIGGDVRTKDAFSATLVRIPFLGSTGEIGGHVELRGGADATVSGLRVAGDVEAKGQTRSVELIDDTVGGSMSVIDADGA